MSNPITLADLFRNPRLVSDALALIRKLEKLSVSIQTADGVVRVPVQFSESDAIVQLTLPSAAPVEVIAPPPPPVVYDSETEAWIDTVAANGGTMAADSIEIADALITAIKAATFNTKIKYLLPLLGANLAAARVPLRDSLTVGAAVNSGFVDADFSQATGIKGNGSSKILDLGFKPGDLASGNGGIGYWETQIDFAGSSVQPMGCYEISGTGARFVIDLRPSVRQFCWGLPGVGFAGQGGVSTGNGHYYGQSGNASLREFFLDGVLIDNDTDTDSRTGANDLNVRLMGCVETSGASQSVLYWKGRCAVAYATDGSMTAGEVAAFHTLLQTYLIAPTGR